MNDFRFYTRWHTHLLHFTDEELVFRYELHARTAPASGVIEAVGQMAGACVSLLGWLAGGPRGGMVALSAAAALVLPGLVERREAQAARRAWEARRRVAEGCFLVTFRGPVAVILRADGREVFRDWLDPNAIRVHRQPVEDGLVSVWFDAGNSIADLRDPFTMGRLSEPEATELAQRLERLFGLR